MPFGSVRRMRTRIGLLLQPKSMRWKNDVFVFGSKLTLASLGDLQWHLFGIMLMLTMASALVRDKHVRVDFLRQHMSERQKHIIDVIGHLVLLSPCSPSSRKNRR